MGPAGFLSLELMRTAGDAYKPSVAHVLVGPMASVSGVELELIAHATEDVEKVLEAARAILPAEARGRVRFRVKELKGHYGNPIRLLRARVGKPFLAQAIFRHILASLPEEDREELLAGLRRRTSGGSLYLRLDKQKALLGQLRLCSSDPIWVRVSFTSSRLEDIREAVEEALRGEGA